MVVQSLPNLNITSPFLGKEGIRLALEGESTAILQTMTGTATSPEPYMIASVTAAVLKTNGLGAQYKAQMEQNSVIGQITVIPDTSALPQYTLYNCAIESVREMPMDGTDATFTVTIRGYYVTNNNLWNLT
ncbi:hypothetical protein WM24_23845 [Burkholderia ubonensis]|nr:hypothetical protein WM24_23845 [Burkholderia ubonensis]